MLERRFPLFRFKSSIFVPVELIEQLDVFASRRSARASRAKASSTRWLSHRELSTKEKREQDRDEVLEVHFRILSVLHSHPTNTQQLHSAKLPHY